MSYIEIKNVNGRQYKYLRKSVRCGSKVCHKTIKYLGPVEPVYGVSKRKKTNASVYARELQEQEREELLKATKSQESFKKDRSRIILLSSDGLFSGPIAGKIGCDERKVRAAIKAFNKEGLAALERKKAKGAKIKFTGPIKKKILEQFSKEPKEFGYAFTAWTLPRFTKHILDNNVVDSISVEKVRQIISEAGAKLKRSKRWQYSPDKSFAKKN